MVFFFFGGHVLFWGGFLSCISQEAKRPKGAYEVAMASSQNRLQTVLLGLPYVHFRGTPK